jgi:hypothetical protein
MIRPLEQQTSGKIQYEASGNNESGRLVSHYFMQRRRLEALGTPSVHYQR